MNNQHRTQYRNETMAAPTTSRDALLSRVAEQLAQLCIERFNLQDFRTSSAIDDLADVALQMKEAGHEMPPALRHALEMAFAALAGHNGSS